MQKKVLSEIDLYYGMIDMPKGQFCDLSSSLLPSDFLLKHLGFYVLLQAGFASGKFFFVTDLWDLFI